MERSSLDTALEVIGVVGVVTLLTVTAASWPNLPDRIPTHFDAGGLPNGSTVWRARVSRRAPYFWG